MAQPVDLPCPLKGSRRVGDSTLALDQMSLRDEKCMFAPAVRRNAKLDRLLGFSDTSCSVQAQQKKSQGTRLRKKSSNKGLKTSQDPPLHAFPRFKFQDEGRHTRGSSPVLGRDEVTGSLPSSMSSSTYSLDKPTSRDFFDHLNGRHDYSNPSSPTSYGESSLQKGFPAVVRQTYNTPGLTMTPQDARHPLVNQGEPQKVHPLSLCRFIPKICKTKRSTTPKSEAVKYRQGSPLHPRNGTDWRHVTVKAQESEDEDASPPRVLGLPRSAKPMKSTEEMQKWLDESRIADRPKREHTSSSSSDPNSQLPSPTLSEPLSEQSTSTTSIQTLTSQKSTRISRRLKEHAIPPEENSVARSKAARAHDKCVAWHVVPNNRDSRDLRKESMLSISSSDDESRTSQDFQSCSKPSRSVVNFSKPRLSRNPSANPSPEKPQTQRVDLQRVQQDSFRSTEIGSPNPWYWSSVKQSGIAIDHTTLPPPSARRKSIPNIIGEKDSGLDISIDLAIDTAPGRQSPPRRFMAVTEHEERLLEAMREKRASMRIESSTEDDATVWSQKLESPRPKTAGGVVRSPTILHGTDVSSFPSPPKLNSAISRSTKTTAPRPELRADLMQRSYLASVHSLDSPLLVASENTIVTHPTHFDALPPASLDTPISVVSPITPTTARLPTEVITTKGFGFKPDKVLGVDRVSKISSRISLKSGEGEVVSAIGEWEKDGDTSDEEEEDLVIWAMEVSVR